MGIEINEVQEIIKNLESSGELSIKEEKYLKIAKLCVQLAAENVALKSFGEKLNDMHNALNGEGTGIQGRAEVACQQVALEAAIEEFDAIETPATDRIVAGIKADGVEEFAAMTEKVGDEEEFYDHGESYETLKYTAKQARLFAQQLREGAK